MICDVECWNYFINKLFNYIKPFSFSNFARHQFCSRTIYMPIQNAEYFIKSKPHSNILYQLCSKHKYTFLCLLEYFQLYNFLEKICIELEIFSFLKREVIWYIYSSLEMVDDLKEYSCYYKSHFEYHCWNVIYFENNILNYVIQFVFCILK